MSAEHEAAQVNPIVRKAADQVANKRRASKPKAKELPRYDCRGQLSLFDTSKDPK
ncbi:hypothetical protein [Nocardia jiangxiensis]|uniref:hypothetical protein n=1 Tax=Nocardia jiangxiensis TaxID=282685 RepID=UPI0002F265EB|nr:hypothetical protein [Nocardia jiangxiensis]